MIRNFSYTIRPTSTPTAINHTEAKSQFEPIVTETETGLPTVDACMAEAPDAAASGVEPQVYVQPVIIRGKTKPGDITQTNEQTLHVHVHNHWPESSYAGDMSGTVLTEEGEAPLGGCSVEVYFGPIAGPPVATAITDAGGAFALKKLCAGYYSLRVLLPEGILGQAHNLRVVPGEVTQHILRIPPVTGE